MAGRHVASCHIAIAVCTAQRPRMLRRCLESLVRLRLLPGMAVEIIVVENEPTPKCADIVASVAARSPHPIRYVIEPQRGIPFARNRAIEECITGPCEWIALIDDDEAAAADWLVTLFVACLEHNADVATGPVRQIYETPPPHWWKPQRSERRMTGDLMHEASTNNVLFSARIVRSDGMCIRFNPRLTYGSEDIDFFRCAHRQGAKIIWVEDAWVEEEVPASRVRPKRLLSRLVMASSSGTLNVVIRDGFWTAFSRFVPKALRRIVVGFSAVAAGALIIPFCRLHGEKIFFYGVTRLMKAIGNIRGLLNIGHHYYDAIDGR